MHTLPENRRQWNISQFILWRDVILISKPDKDLTGKKNVLISLMNIDITIFTKILENQIQKYSFKEDNTSGLDGVYSGSEEFNIWKSVNNSSN